MQQVINSFLAGQKVRQDMDTRNAMSALLGNPSDPQALQQLGRADPEKAMAFQKQQAEIRKGQLKEAGEKLTMTLQLLGSARDEQSYQLAKQRGAQMGLDISSAPPNFDPNWVQSTAQQAQALLGKLNQEAPGLIREFQAYQALPQDQQQQMQQYMQMRYPGMQSPIVLPHNVAPVGGGGAAPTATGPNGEKVQWNGTAWVPMGGSGGNAGGGFLGPL